MIQGILTFQFKINQKESGEIEPEFEPIQLIFRGEKFDEDDFSDMPPSDFQMYISILDALK